MPMVWNAEADAKMLAAILQVYEIKINGEKLKEVASIMGPECTAKACTHRLSKIRGIAQGDNASPNKSKAKTPSKPKAIAAKKITSGKEKQDSSDVSDGEADNDTPAMTRTKRTTPKRNYTQMNGDDSESNGGADDGSDGDAYGEEEKNGSKKVKVEASDD